jgi:hypothetical protein
VCRPAVSTSSYRRWTSPAPQRATSRSSARISTSGSTPYRSPARGRRDVPVAGRDRHVKSASRTSRRQSYRSACAIGHIGPDQRDLVSIYTPGKHTGRGTRAPRNPFWKPPTPPNKLGSEPRARTSSPKVPGQAVKYYTYEINYLCRCQTFFSRVLGLQFSSRAGPRCS